jgi:glycosyltransferase involved in cell wall biosynthesis
MISILIPIHNGIEFIDTSVGSVLKQTFQNWEIIIGVNGHPKNSYVYNTAKEYEKDQRIKVLDFPEIRGKANALNEMVKLCKHNYVAILDVDDIWEKEKLEIQMIYVNEFQYDVVGTKCVYFGDLEGIMPEIPIGDITGVDFKNGNPIINSSVVLRKELCQWVEMGIEDYELWLRLRYKEKGIRFFNCSNVLVKHRIHKESAFNSKRNNQSVIDLVNSYQI